MFFFFLLLFVCLLLLRAKNDGSIEEVRSFIGKKTVKGRVGQNKRSFGSFINKQTNKNVILYVHLCVIYKNTRETCLK